MANQQEPKLKSEDGARYVSIVEKEADDFAKNILKAVKNF